MKAFKVELLILDFDRVGADGIKEIIENQKFPNRCIHPDVMDIKESDIGEWSDDHPMNRRDTQREEYERLFAHPETVTVPRELFDRLTDAAQELQEIRDDDQEFQKLVETVAEAVKLRDEP